MPTEIIEAHGHEHVRATHESTVELTTDDWLTPAGDCILGIEADRAPSDFSSSFVEVAQDAAATITLQLTVGDLETTIRGRGDPALAFTSDRCLVARTSAYVDDRTVMVEADRAAADFEREIVERLQAGDAMTATLTARP